MDFRVFSTFRSTVLACSGVAGLCGIRSRTWLPNPVFEGDTIYSQIEVLSKRESKSRPNVGIVSVKTTGFNQDGTVVITFKRTFMVYKRGRVPETVQVTPPEIKA